MPFSKARHSQYGVMDMTTIHRSHSTSHSIWSQGKDRTEPDNMRRMIATVCNSTACQEHCFFKDTHHSNTLAFLVLYQ